MSALPRFQQFVSGFSFLLAVAWSSPPVRAQLPAGNLVINGDFENINGSGCLSNLGNATLGGTLPTLTGFGGANEIDVYNGMACYGLPAFSGATKVAISTQTPGVGDAFSFGLSSPIHAGTNYTLAFEAHAVADFNNFPGVVDVGISDDPLMFGTLVYSASLQVYLQWDNYSTSFTAPVDAHYLTVQSGGSLHCWTHVDAFVLVPASAAVFCAGDGTHTACPCGNDSPVGADAGCLNSLGVGGRLRTQGNPSLSADTLVLSGDQMPNSSALYIQGLSQFGGGAGTVFGDGLRCVGGTIVRLGVANNVAGASHYPGVGNPAVSVRGMVTSPGVRTYQVWYRNAAPFCTPLGFNLSNGVEVTWGA